MKIAFRGFRGFGKHSEFFDINSITVLTGKNGSGKSTFLKLLDLISTSFSNINKMEDFFSITIDIGNDLFGGKNNMLHSNKMPKMIIETRFEFYIELYEVHFNFEVQDYTMKIKEIELVTKKDKIRVCSWSGNVISANCKYLYKEYQEKAFIYNFMEEYLYYHDDDKDYMNSDDYQLTYYNPQLEYNFIDSLKKHHISPSNEMMYNYIGMKTESQEFSHPFKELYHPGGLGNYIILDIPYEPISLTKKQIYKILKESEYFDELESFQNYGRSKDYNDFNIYESFGLMYKFEVENFLLGNSTKQYNDINVEFERAFLMMAEQNKMKFFGFKAATNGAISDDSLILKKIVLEKIHILYYLAKHSSGIFENKIIDLCTFLGNIQKHSGVNNIASRSYNIYDKTNSFSAFLKEYATKANDEKKAIEKYLVTHIKRLDIAQGIRFFLEGNTGFIYLKKGNKEFSLIDEGSGINNIISILLFLSLKASKPKVEKSIVNLEDQKILILEEPESNLHPNLQSKLADIFVHFAEKTDCKLIIETHSEYLIRKIQYLVAKNQISKDNIIIYYFSISKSKNAVIDIYPIHINVDGSLNKEFGSGFFDEADNLAVELFTLKMAQQN